MIIYRRKEKPLVNIKKRFALFPVETLDREIIWLEFYYYYSNTRYYWRGRAKNYKDRKDFYADII